MKPYKKPEFTLGHKILGTVLIVLLLPIFILVVLFIIGKIFLVYVPVLREIQTVPRYWLTWKQVKLLTGLRTSDTLGLLVHFADGKFMECRLREDAQLERIRQLRKDRVVPTTKKPFFSEHVVYYEFRMVWRGGRKRPSLRELASLLQGRFPPKPALQPAYAR